jgi:hypothetical protein
MLSNCKSTSMMDDGKGTTSDDGKGTTTDDGKGTTERITTPRRTHLNRHAISVWCAADALYTWRGAEAFGIHGALDHDTARLSEMSTHSISLPGVRFTASVSHSTCAPSPQSHCNFARTVLRAVQHFVHSSSPTLSDMGYGHGGQSKQAST